MKAVKIMSSALFVLILGTCCGHVHAAQEPVLYVREGCAHCAKVESFLEEYSLEDKVRVVNLSLDEGASEEYIEKMEELNVPQDEQQVPFLIYDTNQWVLGDTPIIEYLAEKYEISLSETDSSDFLIMGVGVLIVSVVVGYGIFSVVNAKRKA